MIKVITYGTFDLLHYGHVRLLERAKALGDYLIVGVTADDFDKSRGKINVQQSLMERVEAVRETGLADEIIIEEYEGQKIDDIRRYEIDIFTVGSDWVGKFDYLKAYCKVVYLDRTQGISSSNIREKKQKIRLGFMGSSPMIDKFIRESRYVNGIEIAGVCARKEIVKDKSIYVTDDYEELMDRSDAVYIVSLPRQHDADVLKALQKGKSVLCESPVALSAAKNEELFTVAREQGCVLMESIKTAYATAYSRLLLLVKGGKIGAVYSVDATCTSLQKPNSDSWNSICAWGPTALLPVFQILGCEYRSKEIVSYLEKDGYDKFTRISFVYDHAVASVKVGKAVKSEGERIISGTKGYIYVPAPWWKTDYFEVRYEDQTQNKRYFYQLDGEGIRYELLAFCKSIETGKNGSYIEQSVSKAISGVIEDFYRRTDCKEI